MVEKGNAGNQHVDFYFDMYAAYSDQYKNFVVLLPFCKELTAL